MLISTEPSKDTSIFYAKYIFLQYLCISSFSDFTFFATHCSFLKYNKDNKDSSNKTQFIYKGNQQKESKKSTVKKVTDTMEKTG